MCLRLKSEKTRVKIAKEDIVVYKAFKVYTKIINSERLPELKHGDSFTGIIRGVECEGKISIDRNIFFCTNNENLDGYSANDKLDYKYSWGFDSNVHKIIVNGKVINIGRVIVYRTFYQGFKVKMGETYTSELEKIDDTIEKGLHSFETMEVAKSFSNIVAKCIIPKGSKYYEGLFGCDASYASDRITYVEIVK